jgi:hypothetical protein
VSRSVKHKPETLADVLENLDILDEQAKALTRRHDDPDHRVLDSGVELTQIGLRLLVVKGDGIAESFDALLGTAS